jgi:hypothetical protein
MCSTYAVSSFLLYSPWQFQSEIINKNVLWDCATVSRNGSWAHMNMGFILNGFWAVGTGNLKKRFPDKYSIYDLKLWWQQYTISSYQAIRYVNVELVSIFQRLSLHYQGLIWRILCSDAIFIHTAIDWSVQSSHRKSNPSSYRRGGPISKHNGLGKNKNMVVGPKGARKQEWFLIAKASSKLFLCPALLRLGRCREQ